MLTEEALLALPDSIQQHFHQLERDLIAIIVEHIKEIGTVSSEDTRRLDELRRIGFNIEKIEKKVAEAVELGHEEVIRILNYSAQNEYGDAERLAHIAPNRPVLSGFNENEFIRVLVESIANITSNSFRNISNLSAIGFSDGSGKVQSLGNFYQQAIDYAILQARTGQQDFTTSVSSIVRNMADRGLRQLFWESGYSQRLDTAVRREIFGGLAALSQQQSEWVHREVGADGYEITWHSGFRPTHDFGGLQFTDSQFYGTIKPLMEEPNCYHRSFAIIMGLSTPAYSREELQALNREDARERGYEGNTFTRYEAQQHQRKLETAIRKAHDRVHAFKVLDDIVTTRIERTRARLLEQEYNKFNTAMGLPPRRGFL